MEQERTLVAHLTDEEVAARQWWTNLSDRMRVALSYKHFNTVDWELGDIDVDEIYKKEVLNTHVPDTYIFLLENNWIPEDQCGWGNGYIVLPKGHKFHGKHYDDIMSEVDTCEELTYSEPDEEGNWVIGWDSAHYWQTKDNYPFSKVLSQTICIQKQLGN